MPRSPRRRTLRTLAAALSILSLSAGPVLAQPGAAATIPVPGGDAFEAWVAGPEDAPAAVLVVHDWFGVTGFTRETVDRLGAWGYRAVAVDLYAGESATTHERAGELAAGLDPARVDAILDAGLAALARPDRRIATMGFSMGGAPAFRLALRESSRVDAAVVIYGGGIDAPDSTALAAAPPLLAVTGSKDAWALDAALALLPRLEAAGRPLELFVYPGAAHAYAQPLFAEGEAYDAVATRVTWDLVRDFLERRLGDRS